ncbi:hypothetical protein BCV02_10790 [Vibrio breoganii]|nr:hypothetical protein BCV02_10790 [Vibrio breoganii]PML86398.1 hypothetical protein BCT67_14025 [Vibrio breoganii]
MKAGEIRVKEEISKGLKRADLNLLVTLHALLKFKSVKLAAEELYLSQSAVSRALGRLRETFNDELFERTHSGLVPTEKLRSLEAQLSNIVSEIDDLISEKQFNLEQCKESFVLSIPAIIGCHLAPELMVHLQKVAPLASLLEVQPSADPMPLLKSGELDFAVHNFPTFDKNYYCEHLGKIKVALYVRGEHPLCEREHVQLSDLSPYPLLGNMIDEAYLTGYESPVTQLCELVGEGKKPSFRSVQFHSLIATTERTNSVFLASQTLEKYLAMGRPLKKLELAEPLDMSMDIYLIALKSKSERESHKWFIELLNQKITEMLS